MMMMMMIIIYIYIYITIDFSLDFSSSILCESTGLSSISRPKWPVWVLVFRSKPPCIYIQVHPLQDGCGRKNSPIRCGQGHMASSHSTSAGVKAPPRRWITSPGTNLETGMDSVFPSRKPWWKVAEADGKLMETQFDENWWSGKLIKTAGVGQVKKGSKTCSKSFTNCNCTSNCTNFHQLSTIHVSPIHDINPSNQKGPKDNPRDTLQNSFKIDLLWFVRHFFISVTISYIYIYIYYPPPSPAIPKHTRHTLRPYLRHMGYLTPSDWSTPPGRSWPSSLHGSPGRRSPGPLPKSRRSRASPQRLLRWYSSLPTSPAWSPRTETLQKYTWLEAMKIIKYHPIWASFLTLPMKIMKTNSGMTSETDLADFQQKMCRNAMVLALKNQGFLQSLPETTGRHGHSC